MLGIVGTPDISPPSFPRPCAPLPLNVLSSPHSDAFRFLEGGGVKIRGRRDGKRGSKEQQEEEGGRREELRRGGRTEKRRNELQEGVSK